MSCGARAHHCAGSVVTLAVVVLGMVLTGSVTAQQLSVRGGGGGGEVGSHRGRGRGGGGFGFVSQYPAGMFVAGSSIGAMNGSVSSTSLPSPPHLSRPLSALCPSSLLPHSAPSGRPLLRAVLPPPSVAPRPHLADATSPKLLTGESASIRPRCLRVLECRLYHRTELNHTHLHAVEHSYSNVDTGWWMVYTAAPPGGYTPVGDKGSEWILIDPAGADRSVPPCAAPTHRPRPICWHGGGTTSH